MSPQKADQFYNRVMYALLALAGCLAVVVLVTQLFLTGIVTSKAEDSRSFTKNERTWLETE